MPDPERGDGANVQDTVSLSALYARLEAEGHEVDAPDALLGGSPQREAVILQWLDDAAEALVRPLIAVNCLINPPAILIGGRLPGKLVDGLVERLNARMTGVKLPVVAPVRRARAAHAATAIVHTISPYLHTDLPSEANLTNSATRRV